MKYNTGEVIKIGDWVWLNPLIYTTLDINYGKVIGFTKIDDGDAVFVDIYKLNRQRKYWPSSLTKLSEDEVLIYLLSAEFQNGRSIWYRT
jgi:hypothetical protein